MNSDVGGELRYIIRADTSGFEDSLKSVSKAINQVSEDVGKNSSKAGRSLSESMAEGAKGAQSAISRFCSESASQLASLAGTAAGVAKDLFNAFSGSAVAGFTSWAKTGIEDTRFLEDTQIQIQGLTHSTEAGAKAMAAATKYYKNNPFTRFDVTAATKNLLQFGVEVNELPTMLDKLGKVSLSTGAKIDSLAYSYQRSVSDGKVNLIDLNILANQGVPIWDALGKAAGMTTQQVREATAKGGLDIEAFKKAFDYLVDDDAMEAFNKTFSRQVDRFKGRLSDLKGSIAGYSMDEELGLMVDEKGLYRSVTRLLKVFADVMAGSEEIGKKFRNSLGKLAQNIAPFIDKLADKLPAILDKAADAIGFLADHFEMLIPILGGAMVMFGNIGSSIPGLSGVITPLNNGIHKLIGGKGKGGFLGLNPLLQIFVAILGAGAFKAFKDGSLNDAFKSIATSLGKLAQALGPVISQLAEMAANIGAAVLVPTINALAKVLEVLANVISKIPTPILTGLVTALLGFLAVKKTQKMLEGTGKAIEAVTKPLSKVKKASKGGGFGIGELIAGILKPLGDSKVLKGAASAALIGVAIYAIALGIDKVSNTNINVGNLAGMLTATAIIAVIMNVIGKFAKNIAFGAGATTLIGVSLYAVAVGLQKVSTVGSSINIAALGVMAAAIAIAAVIVGVIGLFAKFVALGALATAVLGVGLVVTAWGLAEASKRASEINMGGILLLSAAVALTSIILTALLLFSAFGAVGAIATTVIGVGLAITAATLKFASEEGSKINMAGIVKLGAVIAETSLILTAIIALAVFGAVGAVASAVIGGGLAIAAAGLKSASENGRSIDMGGIYALMDAVAITSGLLTAIIALAAFGAVSAVATTIIAGGLALTALGLKSASENGAQIDMAGIWNLMDAVTLTSTLMGLIMPLSVFGAISSIATSIIAGGLVLTAKGLKEAGDVAGEISPQNLQKLQQAITYVAELQTGNLWANLVNMVNSAILSNVAKQVKEIAETLSTIPIVKTTQVRKIKAAIEEFASISTGGLWQNLTNLINSGMLTKVADNAKMMSETFGNTKPVKIEVVKKIKEAVELFSQIKLEGNGLFEDKGGTSAMLVTVARNVAKVTNLLARLPMLPDDNKINKLKDAIHNFSQIKIEGNGLFENKGEAAAELYKITVYIYRISLRLNAIPEINEDRIGKFVSALSKFKDFTSEARDGIRRLHDLGDSLSNISWIKNIFGDIPADLKDKAGYLVDALTKFSDIDAGTRNDIREFNSLGDSLGNIDWVKHIFGDVPSDVKTKAEALVGALQKFAEIDAGTRNKIRELNSLGDSLGNIDWIKKIVGDLPGGLKGKVEDFVDAIKEFNDIDEGTRKSIRELNNLGDSLGNVDWIKRIIGDLPGGLKTKVEDFVDAIKEFNDIDAGTRTSIRELNNLGDALGNIDWIKQIIGDIKGNKDNVAAFVESIAKFKDLDADTRKSIRELDNLGDALGNIDWIKKIIGDIPADIGNNVETFVKAIAKFKDLDSDTRNSIRELNNLGDSLGNIDWLKRILGDLPENINTKVENFVKAIQEFKGIDSNTRDGIRRLNELGDSLGNIDWIKRILGDITDNKSNVEAFVESVKLFDRIDSKVRDGVMRLASLGDSLGNIDWIKKILGDMTDNKSNVKAFVESVVEFKSITSDVRDGILRLATLNDSLGNIDWIKQIFSDLAEDFKTKATNFIEGVAKFSSITEDVRTGIMRLSGIGDDTIDNLNEFKSSLTTVPEGIVENAQNFVSAINKFGELKLDSNNLSSIAESVNNMVETIKSTLATLPELMMTTGTDLVTSFINGINSKLEETKSQGVALAEALKDGLLSVNDAIKEAGYKAQGSYWQAIQERMHDEYYQGQAMGKEFRQGLYDVDYANSGWWAVQGFINGANNRNWGGAVWEEGRRIANDFLSGLRSAGGEGSPWKTTMKSGIFAGEGFAIGLRSQVKEVKNAAEEIAEAIRSPFEDLDNLSIGVSGGVNGGSGMTKYLTVNQNNNINNGMDYRTMMADLKWELFTA